MSKYDMMKLLAMSAMAGLYGGDIPRGYVQPKPVIHKENQKKCKSCTFFGTPSCNQRNPLYPACKNYIKRKKK